jgi:hypothetical protein
MTNEQQRQLEVAIVLCVLDREHPEPWTVRALDAELGDSLVVRHAIGELEHAGVLSREGERVWASPPARKLDALGMIAV